MVANSDTRQYYGICPNPYVISDDDLFGGNALLVNALRDVDKVVVQGCHGDALSQVYMASYAYWSDDSAVQTYAGITAYGDIANSIVDAAEGLDNTVTAQMEFAVWRTVHSNTTIYLGATPTMLV